MDGMFQILPKLDWFAILLFKASEIRILWLRDVIRRSSYGRIIIIKQTLANDRAIRVIANKICVIINFICFKFQNKIQTLKDS